MAHKIVKYRINENKKYGDTKELFDSLFGRALRILLRREKLEEEADRYEKKRRLERKKSKSPKKNEAPQRAEPGAEEKPSSETEKGYQSPMKYEKTEKANFKAEVKARKSRRRKKMSPKKPKRAINKRRTVLAFILLLALAGAYFYYRSVGDFGKLTESLRSIKKESAPLLEDATKVLASLTSRIKGIIRPEATKNVAEKSANKPSHIARKPMPKNESPSQPTLAAPQKSLLVVRKSRDPAPKESQNPPAEQSYRPVVRPSPKPVVKASLSPAVKESDNLVAHIPAGETSRKSVTHIPKRETAVKAVEQIEKSEVSVQDGHLPAKPPVSYPYSIYLGSYGSRERAEKAVSIHEKKGLFPYWVEVDLGEKGVWFRIFAGYFANKEEAEVYINERQIAEAQSKRTDYANLIGVYKSQNELNRKRLTLSKLGYSPYVIPGVNGESLLYTGAFYQKDRAEKQHLQLASNGVRSRVVSR